jgi:hypothetical protein
MNPQLRITRTFPLTVCVIFLQKEMDVVVFKGSVGGRDSSQSTMF